jgi:hypothetical protein
MSRSVRVLHLDDQPEQASWIPRAINNWFWKHFRTDMMTSDIMEENDAETVFRVHIKAAADDFLVDYRIFEEADPLIAEVKNFTDTHIALVILDQAIKDDFTAGGRAFLELESIAKHLIDRTIVLTAYPGVTCSQLHWSVDDARLIAKPPDTRKIMARFVSGISSVITQTTRSALEKKLHDEESG